MAKLRHISGDNLYRLEQELEAIQSSLVVVNVTQAIGGRWYIHFLVQTIGDDPTRKQKIKIKKEGEL